VAVTVVAVFGDAHAHAEALEAVVAAASGRADELWSLGDMLGGGPDPARVLALTRSVCRVALVGNHDYGARGSVDPSRLGELGALSVSVALDQLGADDLAWLRARRPAARRAEVQCWHGSPRNAVWEFVGRGNAGACLEVQRGSLGLVGHTHVASAWVSTRPGRAKEVPVRFDAPLPLGDGKWLLNPGAVGAPAPSRFGWWDGLDAQAAAYWLELDLAERVATWRRASFDPEPARARARELGLAYS
jgi:predicted phosphodiesterase